MTKGMMVLVGKTLQIFLVMKLVLMIVILICLGTGMEEILSIPLNMI